MKKITTTIAMLAISTSLSGCISIGKAMFVGPKQQISVATTPPGASCQFIRHGIVIAVIPSTPGSAEVDKTSDDILVECTSRGYFKGSYLDKYEHDFQGGANIIMDAAFGTSIDKMRGTEFVYADDQVTIELRRVK